MTDRPDPAEPGPDDTPEIAEVRRLLSDARHTEPMPADVATRMDDVLAGLVAESGSRTAGPARDGISDRRDDVVVPIAAHRRRKVAGLLVAAAAIVVAGVTITPHLGSGSDSAATGAQDSAGSRSSNLGNTGNTGNKSEDTTPSVEPGSGVQVKKGLVVVRPRHFSFDARQGRSLLRMDALTRSAKVPCPDVPGPGERVPAEYQHAPAVLVYRRAQGSAQVVDLYVCGNDRPVRSTTLPVP